MLNIYICKVDIMFRGGENEVAINLIVQHVEYLYLNS